MSEKLTLTPEEVNKRRQRKAIVLEEELEVQDEETQDETANIQPINRGGKVKVTYESMGRFNFVKEAYWSNFTGSDVSDFSVCSEDDILETTLSVLEGIFKKCNPDLAVNYSVMDMSFEDLMETLIAIKRQFIGEEHEHFWFSEYQSKLDEALRGEPQVHLIKLGDLNYKSIEDVDREFGEEFGKSLKSLSKQDFENYLKTKYSDSGVDYSNITVEDEIKNFKIKEPITLNDNSGNIYKFRFSRIGDFIIAQKEANEAVKSRIKDIQGMKYNIEREKAQRNGKNLGVVEFNEMKQDKIQAVEKDKAKVILNTVRALTLLEKNGQKVKTIKEKIELYKDIDTQTLNTLNSIFDRVSFGVCGELDLVCSHTGKTERRLLSREITPLEFLPFNTNTEKQLELSSGNIFSFGI